MKRLFIFIFFLFVTVHVYSQIIEPVKWTFESKQDGLEATLIFKADIETGWHLYDTQLEEGGPIKNPPRTEGHIRPGLRTHRTSATR